MQVVGAVAQVEQGGHFFVALPEPTRLRPEKAQAPPSTPMKTTMAMSISIRVKPERDFIGNCCSRSSDRGVAHHWAAGSGPIP